MKSAPWELKRVPGLGKWQAMIHVADADGVAVFDALSNEANDEKAGLIAAAPDLLAGLKAITAHLENIRAPGSREFAASPEACALYESLLDAIAKAERKQS